MFSASVESPVSCVLENGGGGGRKGRKGWCLPEVGVLGT